MSNEVAVRVPRTIKSVTRALGEIDDTIVVSEWQRAAYVWAHTYEGRPGRPSGNLPELRQISERLTIAEFARLGIPGLKTRDTVAAYRAAWKLAMEEYGAADVRPGQEILLPEADWPGRQDANGLKRYIDETRVVSRFRDEGKFEATRVQVAQDALSDPEIARQVMQSPQARQGAMQASQAVVRHEMNLPPAPRPAPTPRRAAAQEDDERPQRMTKMRVELDLLDYTTQADLAIDAAKVALAIFDKVERFLDDEGRTIVTENAEAAANAWTLLVSKVTGGGVTDQALKALLEGG